MDIKFDHSGGVTFDLEEDSKVASNNFNITETVISPNHHVRKILKRGSKNQDGIFFYTPSKASEKKALIQALEQNLVARLYDKNGNVYYDYYQLTDRGRVFTA